MTRIVAILPALERDAMALDRLERAHDGVSVAIGDVERMLPDIASAEVLVTIGPALGAHADALFRRATGLRWVQSIGTGTDGLLGHPALSPDVAVTNVRGIHGRQMAEAAIGAMLALARDLPRALANQRAARWERYPPRLLAGSTVGILGLGAIAGTVAPRLRALGLTVVGITASPRPIDGFDRVEPRAGLARVVADLDVLLLLTPLTAGTRHIVDAAVLAAMKPGAFLVNLARGGVVDEAALLVALDEGRLAGAALDVFEAEPLPADSPFWRHPRVIVTPHLGGFHAGYAEEVYRAIADNVGRYLAGGTAALANRVDA